MPATLDFDSSLLDTLWVLWAAALVFVMQAGFLCLEAGTTRTKNAINVAMKNVADFAIAVSVFWLVGFGLMFGDSHHGLIGTTLLGWQKEEFVSDEYPYYAICHKCRESNTLSIMSEGN